MEDHHFWPSCPALDQGLCGKPVFAALLVPCSGEAPPVLHLPGIGDWRRAKLEPGRDHLGSMVELEGKTYYVNRDLKTKEAGLSGVCP